MNTGAKQRPHALKGVAPKPKVRRTGHITIRLSQEERINLDELAARAGLMTGSFVRQAIFGVPMPRQVRRPPIERKELARLLGALGKVGGNLNQIAHSLNAGRPVLSREVSLSLDDLQAVRAAILIALGRDP